MSVSDSKRVALLARPGQAREQLRAALHEVGADIVLEDDPNAIDAQTLGDAAPQVVLVALEPAIEEGLEKLDPVLIDPAVAVIFDEAELAARRQGWEAQRWTRHLAAKIHGHADVLPPGREEEPSLSLEPGLPVTPAQLHADDGIEKHMDEAVDLAWELPQDDFAYSPPSTPAAAVIDADEWLRAAAPRSEAESDLPASMPPLPTSATTPVAEPAVSLSGKWELSLEPLDPTVGQAARVAGAVVVFAGIGGPDAVRKLLAELPQEFPRPLIVHLKLDGGRYDNLVRQMARVSAMPVALAEADHPAKPGHVYVLPGDVSLRVDKGAVDFVGGDDLPAAVAQLPGKDSGVVLLSGSDTHWVDVAVKLSAQGAWVAGQSTDGCYDPAASQSLGARGGLLATPVEIARHLATQWPY